MDAANLRELKLYMHVDHDHDDVIIMRLWAAAWDYLEGGGISPEDTTSLAWLAAAGLTLHWYDNPELEGTDTNISVGLRKIINQLKMKHGGDTYF